MWTVNSCVCVFVCGYFTITAKVLDTAAVKPETETVPKSPTKSQTPSESSSLALSTQAHSSPATSLTLSTSAEQENPDEAYILLDECFSGTSSLSLMMSTSSGTPSPGNTLSSGSALPSSVEYQNLDNLSDGKTVDDLPQRRESPQSPSSGVHARRSTDASFEGAPVPECDDSTGDSRSVDGTTNVEYMTHYKFGNGDLPPALPAKMPAVPDVEYDVPVSGLTHGSALCPASSPIQPAPPPQPHTAVMAVPGRMHRYVNTAPAIVRAQTPTSSSMQKHYAESSSASRIQSGPPSARPVQQNASASSSFLPPRAHG